MHLDDIAAKIHSRSCILFLGAGIHAAPPAALDHTWPASQRPTVGAALALRLATRSDLEHRRAAENPTDLMRVALDFEIAKKRRGLIETLREELQTGKRGSPMLYALADIDFPVIITTNYDTHLEDALRVTKRPFVSVYSNNIDGHERTEDYPDLTPTPTKPFVLKIHGDLERNPGSIVITEEDYIQFVLRLSDKGVYDPIPFVARACLARLTTLFVGYSLRDYNLRLLFRALRWRMDATPPTYFVDLSPDPLVQEVLQRRTGQVSYIVEDVWTFVPSLIDALKRVRT